MEGNLNIKSLKLKNFLSHVDSSLTFENSLPYLFVGENGAGKSSLIKDSITWALFGEARAKGAGDELIYNHEDKCKVEVVFEIANSKYQVIRERERNKKTKLTLNQFVDNILKDISNVTMSKTQEDVEKILGFNYLIFSVSACLEQNSRLNFSDLTPKECKETVMKILNIDKFNDYERIAKDKVNKIDTELRIEQSLLEQNQETLKKYAGSKENLKSLILDKEKQLAKKKEIEDNFDTQKLGIEFCITGLQTEIEKNQNRVEELRSSYKTKETRVMEIGSLMTISGSKINEAQQKILKIKSLGTKCPTCESELKDNHIQDILVVYELFLNSNKGLQEDIKPEFNTLRQEMEQIEKEGKELGILDKQTEIKNLTNELTRLMSKKELDISEVYAKISTIDKNISKYESEVTNLDEINKIIWEKRTLIDRLSVTGLRYNVLQDAFGKNGIPAMIISNVTNELEFNINQILRELTNKNISVKVVTEKNLKSSSELADTMEIIVRNGLFERPYNLYSGGEKYRIDLAIRLALSKMLSNRNNFRLETLIVDEPSGLDREGLVDFKETISNLSKMFKKIFVISHLTELIESTEDRFTLVQVRSENGVSFVKGT